MRSCHSISVAVLFFVFFWGAPFAIYATRAENTGCGGDRLPMSESTQYLGGLGQDPRVRLTWIDDLLISGREVQPGSGDYGRRLEHNGICRYYEVHAPPSYKPGDKIAVVLALHGGGGNPSSVRYESGLDAKADRSGFLVVYPAGSNERKLKDRLLVWNDGREKDDGTGMPKDDDVGFIDLSLADLAKNFSIDQNKIYVTGISNGAQFAYYMIGKLKHRIAAVAVVAGQRPAPLEADFCSSAQLPIMQFSGVKDRYAPYGGGSPFIKTYFKTKLLPVRDTIASWALCNKCDIRRTTERTVGQAREVRYRSCNRGAEVILWTISDGGHTWPGGRALPAEKLMGVGHVSTDINATDEMWEFFRKH